MTKIAREDLVAIIANWLLAVGSVGLMIFTVMTVMS